jgi:hypothetical protein
MGIALHCREFYWAQRGKQVFADPPAMRGTSGQVYTDNNIILNLRILIICVHLCPKKEVPILSNNNE